MTNDKHPVSSTSFRDPSLDLKTVRNPVKRFGHLHLEPQLHDPIAGIFDDSTNDASSTSFISTNVAQKVTLLLSLDHDEEICQPLQTLNAWQADGDLSSYTIYDIGNRSVKTQSSQAQPLCLVRLHIKSMLNKKRTVYKLPSKSHPEVNMRDPLGNEVGPAMFNVKKAAFGQERTYYAYLGAHEATDLKPEHPLYRQPFLVMKTSNNRTDIASHFKFTATVTSIRQPTGDNAVDSVLAVKRKSQLVVLASTRMRDVFVFLRHGDQDDKWSWKNEYAPGMLIATGRQVTPGTVNNVIVGPDTMKLDVAAGVDGRVVLAVVLAAVTHYQAT